MSEGDGVWSEIKLQTVSYVMLGPASMPHDEMFDHDRDPRDYTHAKREAEKFRQWLIASETELNSAEEALSDMRWPGTDWILQNLPRAQVDITGWTPKADGAWCMRTPATEDDQRETLLAVLRVGIATVAKRRADAYLKWFDNPDEEGKDE